MAKQKLYSYRTPVFFESLNWSTIISLCSRYATQVPAPKVDDFKRRSAGPSMLSRVNNNTSHSRLEPCPLEFLPSAKRQAHSHVLRRTRKIVQENRRCGTWQYTQKWRVLLSSFASNSSLRIRSVLIESV
jgi:hypothetical protein